MLLLNTLYSEDLYTTAGGIATITSIGTQQPSPFQQL